MKALHIFPFALSLFITGAFAQNNVSVDPLTGSAQVSIPIWQLSEGDISVPIGIHYAGGGVRVEQGEGSAGMSWDLAVGGAVYRDMRGLPDDCRETIAPYRKGWLYNNNASGTGSFSPSADDNLLTCEDEEDDFAFFDGLGFMQDTEPDVFNFYAPGLSGQFVFGNDGTVKVIPYQDLNISYSLNSSDSTIASITIQSNKGHTYYFTLPVQVTRSVFKTNTTPLSYLLADYSRFGNPISYYQSWSLSKITSPGGAEITFSYDLTPEKSSVTPVTVFTESGNEQTLYYIKDSYRERQLNTISSNLANSIFDWEENRISGITIVDNFTGDQRKFNFYYKNVKDYRDTGYSGVRHSFLEKIMQEEDCITFPAHEFSYYGVNLGANTTDLSWAAQNMQDYWGYYNGTSATKKPDIYVYDGQSNAENLRLRPITSQSEDLHLSGSARNVNATAIVTGSIKTIEYPSGSKTTIEYEPNSFFDTISNDTVQGGGIRVSKLVVSDMEAGSEDMVATYKYKQTNGVTSGQLRYLPVYAFYDGNSIIRTADNQAPEGGVMYSRTIASEEGRGSTVYEFLLPAMYPSVSYSSDWTASKSKIAREDHEQGYPCVEIGNQTIGYYSFPFAPSANYDFERGLIDKISTYSENATLVMERSFGYQRLSTTAVNVKALKFDKVLTNFTYPASNFVYSPYQLITNVGKVMVTETTKAADEINTSNLIESVTSYTYSTVHNMLESVSSTNSDGIIYKTEYKYAKDFTITDPDTSKPEVVALKYLNDNFRHGSPVETINTRKEGSTTTTLGANLILYKDYGGNKVFPDKTLVFPQVAGYAATVVTGSSNQQLSIDTDYRDVGMVKSYTSEGLPISSSDNKKHKTGIHYGCGSSVPVAMVSNAWAEETVYDGFETVSSFSLTASGTTSINSGWTGSKALYVTSANTLTRSGVLKANDKYLLSFWVKPNASGQLNYSCVGGSNVTGNIPYTASDQWQYLEKVIDISGVSSSFELQLSSSVAADLDEIKFYPAIATMSSAASRPLAGLTSQTDDRGVSNFKEYDELGREKAVLDRNKNTIQRTEYRYKKEIKTPLNSNFTNSIGTGEIHIGDSATFTAPSNCVSVTYLWKIYHGTDSIASTSPSLNYTFKSIGNYAVKLTVTSTSGTSTTTQSMNSICVQPDAGSVKFTPVDMDIYECEANHTRTIGVYSFIGCNNVANAKYNWYYKLNSSSAWQELLLHTLNDTIDFNIDYYHVNGQESFEIKCVVEAVCLVLDGPPSCQGSYSWPAENIIAFTYHEESQCQ